ncbi:MAG: LysR family transcriptional regulator [Cognatishimia sp.]
MTNSSRMPDWNHIRAFLATANTGSLSAAARDLGLTQPTLSRQVAALEEELGIMLFERVGRTLELTQAGLELLEHTRTMGEAANRVSLVASGQSQDISGSISITSSDVFSAFVLPPALRKLRKAAPDLQVHVVAANDIQDLMRREADIALRHVRPEQPDLIAKLVYEPKAYFYASHEYLSERGTPETFDDLQNHDFISFGDTKEMTDFLTPMGILLSEKNFPIGSKNGLVAWEYCRQGFGVSVMGEDVVQGTNDMVRLFPEMEPIVFPVWLVTHRELHTSRRIRLVFDLLADHFSSYK